MRFHQWRVFSAVLALGAAGLIVAPQNAIAVTCDVPGYGDLLASCHSTQGPCNPGVEPQVVQIGGPDSPSSNSEDDSSCNGSLSDPGRLENGSPVGAIVEFRTQADSDADGKAELRITVRNSSCTGSLTGLYFNATTNVSSLEDLRVTLAPETDWSLGFNRAVDGDNTTGLKAPGFGRFDAAIYNGNLTPNGGDKDEMEAGESLTFIMDIVPAGGGAPNVCSFTTDISHIPPGSPCNTLRNVVGRYQAGPVGDESGVIGPCSGDLAVQLASFEASPADRRVRLVWETASEIDNAGFNVLRRERVRGTSEIVNGFMIPGRGNPLEGRRYEFDDATAINGVDYDYSLEDVDYDGRNTFHGPRRAIANPAGASIELQTPAYADQVTGRLRFAFQTERRGMLEVQVSSDPTFRGRSVSILTGASRRSEVAPSASDQRQIDDMARGSGGVLYWRVRTRDAADALPSDSPTHMFRLMRPEAQ